MMQLLADPVLVEDIQFAGELPGAQAGGFI